MTATDTKACKRASLSVDKVAHLRKHLVALQGVMVDPEHLTLSAGAGAILDNLFFMLGNPGDGVLIPAPYYPAFDIDLQVRLLIIDFWTVCPSCWEVPQGSGPHFCALMPSL